MPDYHTIKNNNGNITATRCYTQEDFLRAGVDLDLADVEAAIEDTGWCGVVHAQGSPIVIVPVDDSTTAEAFRFLLSGR